MRFLALALLSVSLTACSSHDEYAHADRAAPVPVTHVVETTTVYPANVQPVNYVVPANRVNYVVTPVERGSAYHRDRYYSNTYHYDHGPVLAYDTDIRMNRADPHLAPRGNATYGMNDPQRQDNRWQYYSCPPGQAKKGFC